MNRRQKEILQSQLNDEKEVLENIKSLYEQALNDIDDKIAALIGRTDTENLKSIIYQVEYQKAIKQQINGILDVMNAEQFDSISEYLTKCYDEGFLGTMYDLQGQGVPFVFQIDQEQVTKAVLTDSKLSKSLYAKLGEDVDVMKKRVASGVSRGISQGLSYAQIAKNIRGASRVPMSNAYRIARTEGHRIANSAAFDAQEKAKEKGADVVKQWDATLDGRTRLTHRELDGQIREIDESFEIAGHKAMFPGNFGIPSEDCNCRCQLLQRARWALASGFTKYDNFTEEIRRFNSPEDYAEFQKWYFSDENVKYMKYVSDLENKYGTKNFSTLLNSMSEQEYKHFHKLESESPLWSFEKRKKHLDKNGISIYNDNNKIMGEPIIISGVQCTKRIEKYSFSDGTETGIKKTADSVIYTTPDGTDFVFPKKYNKQHQPMTPAQAIACWQNVPQSVRTQAQKTIEFVDYYNPQDVVWRKRYKNLTHSYATGGDKITFYRYDSPHDSSYVTRTYCHEAGHFIDKNAATVGKRFSEENRWSVAMQEDYVVSRKMSPTNYGENANTEDFAESIAEYIIDKNAFTIDFPNRADILSKVFGL